MQLVLLSLKSNHITGRYSNLAFALPLVRIRGSYYHWKLKNTSSGVQYYMLPFTLTNMTGIILHHVSHRRMQENSEWPEMLHSSEKHSI